MFTNKEIYATMVFLWCILHCGSVFFTHRDVSKKLHWTRNDRIVILRAALRLFLTQYCTQSGFVPCQPRSRLAAAVLKTEILKRLQNKMKKHITILILAMFGLTAAFGCQTTTCQSYNPFGKSASTIDPPATQSYAVNSAPEYDSVASSDDGGTVSPFENPESSRRSTPNPQYGDNYDDYDSDDDTTDLRGVQPYNSGTDSGFNRSGDVVEIPMSIHATTGKSDTDDFAGSGVSGEQNVFVEPFRPM